MSGSPHGPMFPSCGAGAIISAWLGDNGQGSTNPVGVIIGGELGGPGPLAGVAPFSLDTLFHGNLEFGETGKQAHRGA